MLTESPDLADARLVWAFPSFLFVLFAAVVVLVRPFSSGGSPITALQLSIRDAVLYVDSKPAGSVGTVSRYEVMETLARSPTCTRAFLSSAKGVASHQGVPTSGLTP